MHNHACTIHTKTRYMYMPHWCTNQCVSLPSLFRNKYTRISEAHVTHMPYIHVATFNISFLIIRSLVTRAEHFADILHTSLQVTLLWSCSTTTIYITGDHCILLYNAEENSNHYQTYHGTYTKHIVAYFEILNYCIPTVLKLLPPSLLPCRFHTLGL